MGLPCKTFCCLPCNQAFSFFMGQLLVSKFVRFKTVPLDGKNSHLIQWNAQTLRKTVCPRNEYELNCFFQNIHVVGYVSVLILVANGYYLLGLVVLVSAVVNPGAR